MTNRQAFILCLLVGGMLGLCGCRTYNQYTIELRDVGSHLPVENAVVNTRYNPIDEFFGALRWHRPKHFTATTDSDGRARIKVEQGYSWNFQIAAGVRPHHAVSFNEDGTLNQSLGKTEDRDGWIQLRPFPSDEEGSLEASITPVDDAD